MRINWVISPGIGVESAETCHCQIKPCIVAIGNAEFTLHSRREQEFYASRIDESSRCPLPGSNASSQVVDNSSRSRAGITENVNLVRCTSTFALVVEMSRCLF